MRILPFRVASDDSVTWAPPIFELNDTQYPAGPLPEWTYQTPVRVIGQVSVNAEQLRASTLLDSLDDVIAVMQVESRMTGYRECVDLPVEHAIDRQGPLVLDVAAGTTAEELEVRYWLVWKGLDREPDPKRTVHLGAGRLHSDGLVHRAQLEGEGSGFPSEAFSFGEGGIYPPDALWFLSFRPDLEQPFMANARVFINTDHERHGDLLTGRETAAKQVLFHGVLQQMLDTIAMAIDPNDILIGSSEAGSTGAVLNDLSLTFLSQDLAMTVRQLRDDRARVLARLQGATGLLTGGVR